MLSVFRVSWRKSDGRAFEHAANPLPSSSADTEIEPRIHGDRLNCNSGPAQAVLGVAKEKAWMNYAAVVGFGGVLGPFASTALMHHLTRDAAPTTGVLQRCVRARTAHGLGDGC